MRSRDKLLGSLAALFLWVSPLSAGAAPLVGPSVGDADALVAQGNDLYNRKQYAKAADVYLRANRADPGRVPTYLSLARAQLAAKRQVEACNAYRAYLRAASEADASKARRELELCERQLRASRKRDDSAERFAKLTGAFQEAMQQKRLLGNGGAYEALRQLVDAGYVSTELVEMAAGLHAALLQAGDELHAQALAHQPLGAQRLSDAKASLGAATETGAAGPLLEAKIAFLEGCLELAQGVGAKQPQASGSLQVAAVNAAKAERHFERAAQGAPDVSEYKFFRALALYRQGKVNEAREAMQRDLPADPRTAVLSALLLLETSRELAAAEVEQLLFSQRFPKPVQR